MYSRSKKVNTVSNIIVLAFQDRFVNNLIMRECKE